MFQHRSCRRRACAGHLANRQQQDRHVQLCQRSKGQRRHFDPRDRRGDAVRRRTCLRAMLLLRDDEQRGNQDELPVQRVLLPRSGGKGNDSTRASCRCTRIAPFLRVLWQPVVNSKLALPGLAYNLHSQIGLENEPGAGEDAFTVLIGGPRRLSRCLRLTLFHDTWRPLQTTRRPRSSSSSRASLATRARRSCESGRGEACGGVTLYPSTTPPSPPLPSAATSPSTSTRPSPPSCPAAPPTARTRRRSGWPSRRLLPPHQPS